ncbi:MAG: chorismate-binding protein [Parachlamydiaceae bacterium]|nr:chorismate-binding protein [Parachlamydiaceae bacterium]
MKTATVKSQASRALKGATSNLQMSDIEQWLIEGVIFSHQPGKILIAWGESYWHETPKEKNSNWFYFPDFFLSEKKPWLHFEKSSILPTSELISLLDGVPLETPKMIKWKNPSKDLFVKGFQELQGLLRSRKLEKVVHYALSKSSDTITPSHRKRAILSILKNVQETPVFAYGFWKDSQGILGATPELLFKVQKSSPKVLETMALAGTQKTDSLSYQMLDDEKLLHEHDIVVDEIALRLSSFGQVDIGKLQILSLPILSHLYTPFCVRLHHADDFSTFANLLHPTPSLGGRPRDTSMKWLHTYNRILPRGRYGAPVGYWDSLSNEQVCYVAIRNIMWDDNGLMMGAGGGIIAESDLEMEWQEVLLKTKSIVRLLDL